MVGNSRPSCLQTCFLVCEDRRMGDCWLCYAGPELDIEQQAFRAFSRGKTVFFNVWLIVCWFFVWEAADFIGALASSYDYSIIAGRVTGFLITGILLLLATIVLDEIIDEILIRKILKPCGADFTKYALQRMNRGFGLPFH
jgi:hypothetical protein